MACSLSFSPLSSTTSAYSLPVAVVQSLWEQPNPLTFNIEDGEQIADRRSLPGHDGNLLTCVFGIVVQPVQ
ncbi:uncharacterized [Tachysurus ichikawai]